MTEVSELNLLYSTKTGSQYCSIDLCVVAYILNSMFVSVSTLLLHADAIGESIYIVLTGRLWRCFVIYTTLTPGSPCQALVSYPRTAHSSATI